MYHCVYKTVNQINEYFYIGVHSTRNIYDDYLGSGNRLKHAIRKYGKENFQKEIIAVFNTKEEALSYEFEMVNEITLSNTYCYNLTIGGGCPPSRENDPPKTNLLKGENRTEKQKIAAREHSRRMKGKVPWNKGTTGQQKAWNKGIKFQACSKGAKIKRICPNCGKEGNGSAMFRWHFSNCREK